jgi:hypothetical protein
VTYKTGFGLDLLHLIHSQIGTIGNYSAIAILYTFQFTVPHALAFSVFTSRNLATELSPSQCNFKSHMKSSFYNLITFLPLFCNCQFRRLDSIKFLCSQANILAGWRLETLLFTSALLFSTVLCCRTLLYNCFARTMQKIQPLLLFIAPLPNSIRSIVARVSSCWNVFTESLPSNGYTHHNMFYLTQLIQREATGQSTLL